MADKVKILYILGSGRCGSTLLEEILSGATDFFATGELMFLWDGRVQENYLCGCGQDFATCSFWGNILTKYFDDSETALDYEFLRRSIYRNAIKIFAKYFGIKIKPDNDFMRYSSIIENLYKTIHKVSGTKVIIDSSKATFYGFFLSSFQDFDIRFVHLTRDPRGVAYSWMKKTRRPETIGNNKYLPQWSSLHGTLDWLKHNTAAHILQLTGGRYLRVRYEDLVEEPQKLLSKIFEHVDLESVKLVNNGKFSMHSNHTVAGNPMRFNTNKQVLKLDNVWKKALSRSQIIMISTITFPLSLLYGYIIHRTR